MADKGVEVVIEKKSTDRKGKPSSFRSTSSRNANRVFWTAAEEEALLKGVKKYGVGAWQAILVDPAFVKHFHPRRTGVDLKDKYRNLQKHLIEQPEIDESSIIDRIEDIRQSTNNSLLYKVKVDGIPGSHWVSALPAAENWDALVEEYMEDLSCKLKLAEKGQKTAKDNPEGIIESLAAKHAIKKAVPIGRTINESLKQKRKAIEENGDEGDENTTPVSSPVQEPPKSHRKRIEDTLMSAKKLPQSPLRRSDDAKLEEPLVDVKNKHHHKSPEKHHHHKKSRKDKKKRVAVAESASEESEDEEEQQVILAGKRRKSRLEEELDEEESNSQDLPRTNTQPLMQSSQQPFTQQQPNIHLTRSPMKVSVVVPKKNEPKPKAEEDREESTSLPVPAKKSTRSSNATGKGKKGEQSEAISELFKKTRPSGMFTILSNFFGNKEQ